ncbi:hypothetical protein BJF85_21565 [Saccharomonospora sp. CUA-673]|uniref:hypothetical protein n=1 Tax=Saccharomonospora sp. CUA-673 TaxID=1904969 RepID=UPI00095A8460|nr:hypothetical protein [Saccharomonospora sp. CUA-673]OLT43665.1 hypothetical protein BJF85_21565 [Saccharomonospora sp. CUA-673]
MRKDRPALAVCALLALTACGAEPAGAPAAGALPPGTPEVTRAAPSGDTTIAPVRHAVLFGSDHRFASDLVVQVSEPQTFTPGDAAYPDTDRAAAVTVKVRNESAKPYRLSRLSVRAFADDEQLVQVVDPAQGYPGIVDADRDLIPGDRVELPFAFVAPEGSGTFELAVQPDPNEPARAVYHGGA